MSVIPWQRRVEYAHGYLALGMLADATAELALLHPDDRARPEVLSVLCDLHSEAKAWSDMMDAGHRLAAAQPDNAHGWISWAFALREIQRIEEARDVLLRAEARHPQCGTLHYNLACYYCLLGEPAEAERRLRRALSLDRNWKAAALNDPDLRAMRERIVAW